MIIQQSVKMLFSIFILPPNAFNFLDLKTILTGDFIVFLQTAQVMWSQSCEVWELYCKSSCLAEVGQWWPQLGLWEGDGKCCFPIIQSDSNALQQNSKPSWFFRISEISMKHLMQDDGICHNLHCPGKMRVDRATQLGALSCPTGRSQRKLGRNNFVICASVANAS